MVRNSWYRRYHFQTVRGVTRILLVSVILRYRHWVTPRLPHDTGTWSALLECVCSKLTRSSNQPAEAFCARLLSGDRGEAVLVGGDVVDGVGPLRYFRLPVQAADCNRCRNRILVFTAPLCAHSNLWTARSLRVGCCSTAAGLIGLRHFGQVSFI